MWGPMGHRTAGTAKVQGNILIKGTHTLGYRYNGNGCMPTQKVLDEKLVFNKICIIVVISYAFV